METYNANSMQGWLNGDNCAARATYTQFKLKPNPSLARSLPPPLPPSDMAHSALNRGAPGVGGGYYTKLVNPSVPRDRVGPGLGCWSAKW